MEEQDLRKKVKQTVGAGLVSLLGIGLTTINTVALTKMFREYTFQQRLDERGWVLLGMIGLGVYGTMIVEGTRKTITNIKEIRQKNYKYIPYYDMDLPG